MKVWAHDKNETYVFFMFINMPSIVTFTKKMFLPSFFNCFLGAAHGNKILY